MEVAAQIFGGFWVHVRAVLQKKVGIFYVPDAEVVVGAEVFDGGG